MENEGQKISGILAKAFGEELRNVRTERGLSQEELGFESGYHRTYISLLERGLKIPSLQTTFRLSSALGIAPSEFIKDLRWIPRSLLGGGKRRFAVGESGS